MFTPTGLVPAWRPLMLVLLLMSLLISCGIILKKRAIEWISNMGTVIEYLPGQLKCEDCIYCDNCETKWKRCVANYVDVGNVVHLVFCDKRFNKEVADEVVEILNDLNK